MFCGETSLCIVLALLLKCHVFASEKIEINVSEKHENVSLSSNTTQSTNVLTQKPITPTASEVDDLLHGGEFKNLTHHVKTDQELIPYSEVDVNFENNGKWDIELIEDGSNTEDDRFKHFAKVFHDSQNSGESYQLVTVLVVSVIVIAIAGYAARYSWKKLDGRRRKRQVLVNEIDPDDMRNFSI